MPQKAQKIQIIIKTLKNEIKPQIHGFSRFKNNKKYIFNTTKSAHLLRLLADTMDRHNTQKDFSFSSFSVFSVANQVFS